MIFRVGDFSLDGYPDVIATVRMNRNGKSSVTPLIIENIEYPDNANFSRYAIRMDRVSTKRILAFQLLFLGNSS